jgi:mannose-6-phosphate isomerase-like protein (cupin superfamily)
MRRGLSIVLAASFAGAPAAQTPLPPPAAAMDLTAAEMRAMVDAYPGQNAGAKSIDAGDHVVDFWLESRKPSSPGAAAGIVHAEITEIYYIFQGTATLVTGGALTTAKPAAVEVPAWPGSNVVFDTPTFAGPFEGGVARKVGPGDFIVVPPGTVHQWQAIDPPGLVYFIARVDPKKKLTGGYVNPALRK